MAGVMDALDGTLARIPDAFVNGERRKAIRAAGAAYRVLAIAANSDEATQGFGRVLAQAAALSPEFLATLPVTEIKGLVAHVRTCAVFHGVDAALVAAMDEAITEQLAGPDAGETIQ